MMHGMPAARDGAVLRPLRPAGLYFGIRRWYHRGRAAVECGVISRRNFLAIAAALAGCGAPRDAAALLPETVGESWRRTALRDVPPADAPEPPARATVRRVVRADYAGPGQVEATLYELTSSTAALDAVQRIPPEPGRVFFYKDEYFVLVAWRDAEREAVGEFVRALERHVGAEGRGL